MPSGFDIAQVTLTAEERKFHVDGTRFDHKKIMALPDKDFEAFYLILMQEYKEKNGYWSEGRPVSCWRCHDPIAGPEEMRKYAGQCLHQACFNAEYAEDLKLGHVMPYDRPYFDRVARLPAILGK